MTCAACQARVQRALQRQPGRRRRLGEPDDGQRDRDLRPGRRSRPRRWSTRSARPATAPSCRGRTQTAFEEQEARDRRTGGGVPRAAPRRRSSAASSGIVAMIVSMPLMAAGAHATHGPVADPFMRWAMESLTPALRSRDAVALRRSRRPSSRGACSRLTLGVMAWAGRHFYTRAWAAFRHHSADMNTLVAVGTGAAFLYSVVATVAPGLLRLARRGAGRVLRGGDHHHRADPHRQRVRGAGQAPDVGRAARARRPAAEDGARGARVEAEADVPVEQVQSGDMVARAARRAGAGGRRGPVRRERGGRVDAHRRVACRSRRRRATA